MKRVTGIGGIFFKARDPTALRAWYQEHLGIDVQPWGGAAFVWADDAGNAMKGTTIWNIGDADNDYYAPSTSSFMVNYRVADLARAPRGAAQGRLQRPRQDGRLRVRQVRLGHGPRREQGRALAAAAGLMTAIVIAP